MYDGHKSRFKFGDWVRKRTGSSWRGRVVGFYSTGLTPDGICVESWHEPGSVQIYPAQALEMCGSRNVDQPWPVRV